MNMKFPVLSKFTVLYTIASCKRLSLVSWRSFFNLLALKLSCDSKIRISKFSITAQWGVNLTDWSHTVEISPFFDHLWRLTSWDICHLVSSRGTRLTTSRLCPQGNLCKSGRTRANFNFSFKIEIETLTRRRQNPSDTFTRRWRLRILEIFCAPFKTQVFFILIFI